MATEPTEPTQPTPPTQPSQPTQPTQPAPPPSSPIVYWEAERRGPASRFGIGEVMGRSFDTYGSQASLFLALALPAALLAGLAGAIPGALGVGGVAAVLILAAIATLIGSVLMIVATDELWQGREPGIGALLGRALGRTPALFGAYLLAVLVVVLVFLVVGITVLAVPQAILGFVVFVLVVVFLWASVRLTPLGQVIVLERVGGLASFRRAWQLSTGTAWRLLGLLLAVGLVTLPISLGAQLMATISSEPVVDGLATLLASLVTTPLLAISTTLAWAGLAERPQADNEVVRRGHGRAIALVLVLGLGIVLMVAGFSGAAAGGFAGLLPEAGAIRAGTQQNPVDPCRPLDVRTQFTTAETLYIGGYFSELVPPGRSSTIEVYRDGVLAVTEALDSGVQPIGCYYEPEPVRLEVPAVYRILVRYEDRIIADGSFTVVR